jgi:hypothetical protein
MILVRVTFILKQAMKFRRGSSSASLSLTSAWDWSGWSTPDPRRFAPGNDTRYYPFYDSRGNSIFYICALHYDRARMPLEELVCVRELKTSNFGWRTDSSSWGLSWRLRFLASECRVVWNVRSKVSAEQAASVFKIEILPWILKLEASCLSKMLMYIYIYTYMHACIHTYTHTK